MKTIKATIKATLTLEVWYDDVKNTKEACRLLKDDIDHAMDYNNKPKLLFRGAGMYNIKLLKARKVR